MAARSPSSGLTWVSKSTFPVSRSFWIIRWSCGYPGNSFASACTCCHCAPSKSVVTSR